MIRNTRTLSNQILFPSPPQMRGLTSFPKGQISDRTTLQLTHIVRSSPEWIYFFIRLFGVFSKPVFMVTMQIRLFERESTLAKRSCENNRVEEALMHKALVSNINGQRTGLKCFALFSEEDSRRRYAAEFHLVDCETGIAYRLRRLPVDGTLDCLSSVDYGAIQDVEQSSSFAIVNVIFQNLCPLYSSNTLNPAQKGSASSASY